MPLRFNHDILQTIPTRSSKKQGRLADPNKLAFRIVQAVTGQPAPVKDAAMAAGLKDHPWTIRELLEKSTQS